MSKKKLDPALVAAKKLYENNQRAIRWANYTLDNFESRMSAENHRAIKTYIKSLEKENAIIWEHL
jgi:hypothetical protein